MRSPSFILTVTDLPPPESTSCYLQVLLAYKCGLDTCRAPRLITHMCEQGQAHLLMGDPKAFTSHAGSETPRIGASSLGDTKCSHELCSDQQAVLVLVGLTLSYQASALTGPSDSPSQVLSIL